MIREPFDGDTFPHWCGTGRIVVVCELRTIQGDEDGWSCRSHPLRIGECFRAKGFIFLYSVSLTPTITITDESYRYVREGHINYPRFNLIDAAPSNLRDMLGQANPSEITEGEYEICQVRPDEHVARRFHSTLMSNYTVCVESAENIRNVDGEDKAPPCTFNNNCPAAPATFKNPSWQDQGTEFRGNWFHVATPAGYRACAEPPATSTANGFVVPLDKAVSCAEIGARDDVAERPDYVSVRADPEFTDLKIDELVQEYCASKDSGLLDGRVEHADVMIDGWNTTYCTGMDAKGRHYRIALAYGGGPDKALLFHAETRSAADKQAVADAVLADVLRAIKRYAL